MRSARAYHCQLKANALLLLAAEIEG